VPYIVTMSSGGKDTKGNVYGMLSEVYEKTVNVTNKLDEARTEIEHLQRVIMQLQMKVDAGGELEKSVREEVYLEEVGKQIEGGFYERTEGITLHKKENVIQGVKEIQIESALGFDLGDLVVLKPEIQLKGIVGYGCKSVGKIVDLRKEEIVIELISERGGVGIYVGCEYEDAVLIKSE